MRAGERLTTQAGLDDLSPAAWTGLGTSIKNIPSSGSATFALDVDFDCSDYVDFGEIPIPTGTNVTIHGNGAVLDAAQQGQFFNVNSGATLALDHLTLRNGLSEAMKEARSTILETLLSKTPTSSATNTKNTMHANKPQGNN